MVPDDTTRDWHVLRSTTRERLGTLTRREDVWRLPTGVEKASPMGAARGRRPARRDPGSGRAARIAGGGRRPREGRLTFLSRFFPSTAYLDETAYCFIGEELVADRPASDDDEFFEQLALLAAALRRGLRP